MVFAGRFYCVYAGKTREYKKNPPFFAQPTILRFLLFLFFFFQKIHKCYKFENGYLCIHPIEIENMFL